jgi:hypothetical protein
MGEGPLDRVQDTTDFWDLTSYTGPESKEGYQLEEV